MPNFVDGLFVDRSPKAPDFIKANLSFQVDKFIDYLKSKANANGYVNITIKESKGGKMYAELNTWTPEKQTEITPPIEQPIKSEDLGEVIEDEINVENIPFN